MPEIPEMEHYRQLLAKTVVGKQIEQAEIARPKRLNFEPTEFQSLLAGEVIEAVTRRAKYLIFQLQGGRFLLTHMMLDGRLFYGETGETKKLPGKPEVVLHFRDGTALFFCDLRLGFLHLIDSAEVTALNSELGIEPLGLEFTLATFSNLLRGRRGAIKPLLMDQQIICGIGNAYSNEILFAAGILPDRKVPALQDAEFKKLWEVIPRVLHEGIKHGGYIEEPFASWDETAGGQNAHFQVYDRGGQPCFVCGTIISATKIQGRWAYYCTICQK